MTARLTPDQFIKHHTELSKVRIEEKKADAEIDKAKQFGNMVESLMGSAGQATSELLRNEPTGQLQQEAGVQQIGAEEVNGRMIGRGYCPDCAKKGKQTLLVVENPQEGGKYVCPQVKVNHPEVPYVIWQGTEITK